MGLFSKMFNSDKQAGRGENPSFDSLVEKSKTSGQAYDLSELYRHFLLLNEWVFITPSRLEIENAKPFIGVVDEKPWVFVFTDKQKANEYGRQFDGFVRDNGSIFLIQMNVKNSLEMFYQLSDRGVFGIRVNEGPNGWFCPIQDLTGIIKYLNIEIT